MCVSIVETNVAVCNVFTGFDSARSAASPVAGAVLSIFAPILCALRSPRQQLAAREESKGLWHGYLPVLFTEKLSAQRGKGNGEAAISRQF